MLSVECGQGEFQKVSLIPTMIFTLLVVWCADSVYNIEVRCRSCYKRMKQNLEYVGITPWKTKTKYKNSRRCRCTTLSRLFRIHGVCIFRIWLSSTILHVKRLFLRLVDEISEYDSYFVQKKDVGKLGLSAIQKCAAAVEILGYGMTPDALDQYLRIAKSTTREAIKRFVKVIQALYKSWYLRKSTREDILQQMQINERQGWPWMFASIDCMHYHWKNCHVAWQGHYQNKDHNRNIVLEAVADQSLWIWHVFLEYRGQTMSSQF